VVIVQAVDADSPYATPVGFMGTIKSPEDTLEFEMAHMPGKYMYRPVHNSRLTTLCSQTRCRIKYNAIVPGVGIKVIYQKEFEVVKAGEKPVTPTQPAAAATAATGTTPTALPVITIPTYDSWEAFFKAAQIPDIFLPGYTAIMNAHQMDVAKVKSFDYPFLTLAGIATPGHQLLIMDKVNEIKTAEVKQFIGQYLTALVNPSAGISLPDLNQALGSLQK